jgi:hypothetical protein
MGSPRYDQYERPGLGSVLATVGLSFLTGITPALVILFFSNGKYIIALLLLIVWAVTGYVLYRRDKQFAALHQVRRDQAALRVFNTVQSAVDEKFSVFLRPFYTMDKIKLIYPIMNWSTGNPQPSTSYVDLWLEDTIVQALRKTLPVVALGKPGETFGIGRILVDEDEWQAAATKLMRRAALIIFQPSSRRGSAWEMEQILHHRYLYKTVFIVPPHPRKWDELTDDWSLLREKMASAGIAFPEYAPTGLLFAIDAKGRCVRDKLSLHSEKKLLEAFIRLTSPVIRGPS